MTYTTVNLHTAPASAYEFQPFHRFKRRRSYYKIFSAIDFARLQFGYYMIPIK